MKHALKFLGLVVVIILIASSFFVGKRVTIKETPSSSVKTEKKVRYWVAPMDPSFRSDSPGKSPMGMDLVPVYEEGDESGAIKISAAVENNIGIRTEKVTTQTIDQTIHAVGYVKPNDDAVESVNSYSNGWVRKLAVKTVGEKVTKQQLLFKLYSPEIISAQEEYLLAIKYHNSRLQTAGEKKLLTLGMSPKEIKALSTASAAHKEMSVYAPLTGYVTSLDIKEGQHITPNLSLITIADLSTVWVMAEIYEKNATSLELGQKASVTFSSLPGKTFTGKVDYIYPQLNTTTRTLKVRVALNNPTLELKPDMYANLTLENNMPSSVLAVPKEALIRLGETDRIILALGEGRFRSTPIITGVENNEWVEVTQGLKAGDTIVVSSQFLLDSESNLKAGLARAEDISPSEAASDEPEKTTSMTMSHHAH